MEQLSNCVPHQKFHTAIGDACENVDAIYPNIDWHAGNVSGMWKHMKNKVY